MTTLITHVTLADLLKTALTLSTSATPSLNEPETPVLRSIAEARSKGYECIGLPLTNDSWRLRWQNMCLLPQDEKPDKHSLEVKAEQWRIRPCFTRDEVNVTQLGEYFHEVLARGSQLMRMDFWFSSSEEAEGLIAFVSDWLELDAWDDWVRHDAETVRPSSLSSHELVFSGSSLLTISATGTTARAGIRLVSGHPHRYPPLPATPRPRSLLRSGNQRGAESSPVHATLRPHTHL